MSALRPFITLTIAIALLSAPLGCGTEADGSQGQADTTTPTPDVTVDVTTGPDATPPPDASADTTPSTACTTGDDCAGISVGTCQVVVCDVSAGICVVGADKNYTPCDDEDACTSDEVCFDGLCSRGVQSICDDGNPCTTDTCEASAGCQFEDNEAACDDGNGCTTGDSCQAGECAGVETDACSCETDEDCADADDDDLCNGVVRCEAGSCQIDPASVITCEVSDDNPCTQDVCNPATGACSLNLLSNLPCSDGNTCTEGDTCADGVCEGTVAPCGCEADEDCAVYDDDDLCNGIMACVDGACATDPNTVVDCGLDATPLPCRKVTCTPTTGECAPVDDPNGTTCDDGQACTNEDQCSDGACVGAAVLCDDSNDCTDDTCDEDSQGCVFANNTAICDDQDPCTEGDTCADGACAPGESLPCDDDDPCTVDTCDPAQGCVFSPTTCDDGDECTTDACVGGDCTHTLDESNPACTACGDDLECGDDDPCTEDSCDATSGLCVNVDKVCDDGDPCTSDSCNADGGCDTAPLDSGACDDGNDCTLADSCIAGDCVGVPDPTCSGCGDDACDGGETCATCPLDCGGCEGSCCESNGSAGCADATITACVCANDDLCCTGTWDDACAETASELCGADCPACGDGECGDAESCLNCEADCGTCADDACCTPHATPGCADAEVTACACEADDYCCLVEWDEYCVEEAVVSCGLACAACGDGECGLGEDCATCPTDCGACPTCGDGACDLEENCGSCAEDCGACLDGPCCEPNGTAGCEDAETTSCVCDEDPLCCEWGWDELCVAIAVESCGFAGDCPGTCGDGTCDPNEGCQGCAADCGECTSCGDNLCNADENCTSCPSDCGDCDGGCCETNDTAGCEDPEISGCVCDTVDPWCCEVEWDELCVEAAKQSCDACNEGPTTGPCCDAHGGIGCEDEAVQACVCAEEPFCCDGKWDAFCVAAANTCGAECADGCGDGVCGPTETCASCTDDCGACQGPCCGAHPGVGCVDADTTACVCDIDASCCDAGWGPNCAIQAVVQCGWTDDCGVDCGDGVCALGETCDTCDADCGACGVCGDDQCGPTETCASCPGDCGDCEGPCCEPNASAGCDDPDVTSCVCDADAWCCALIWDELCVEAAADCDACVLPACGDDTCDPNETCTSCAEDCGACEGDCCEPHTGTGCGEPDVEACVCDVAPFCCTGKWDIICAAVAAQECGATCVDGDVCGDGQCTGDETCGTCLLDCGDCEGDCCAENTTPGCFDPMVTSCVCQLDDFCCTFEWDESCVVYAGASCGMDCDAEYCGNGTCGGDESCESCPVDCGPCATNACCAASPDGAPGCADAAIEACVCDMLPDCCDETWGWDIQCAGLADSMCGADCETEALSCCEPHDGVGCTDLTTEACVCEVDPDCCDIAWDDLCVETAAECGACGAAGSCCEAHGGLGCDEPAVEACVCDNPDWDYCCWFTWDEDCAAAAQSAACGGCDAPPAVNNCCTASPDNSPGCEEAAVAECVCAVAEGCCTDLWDGLCAEIAIEECGATCSETDSCGDGTCEAPIGVSYLVSIAADGFDPQSLTIAAGDSVTWINNDANPHSASSSSGPVPFNIPLFSGQQGTVVFLAPGQYDYYDVFNATLTGSLQVGPAANGETCASCPKDCGPCPGQGDGDCCTATDGPGCLDATIQSCVCDADPDCCDTAWDWLCVDEAIVCGGCMAP